MDITAVPFNRLIGIAQARQEGRLLSLPNDARYTNHLGTVHAAALLALAEASSGEYLIRELGGISFEVVPVVRRVEAKFRKPAHGGISSTVNVTPEAKAEFIATLTTRGRALIEIPVDVRDESETHALAATVEWFVARKE
jgi:acyl-coenzyme A thioesterase PaaI-like protein